MQSVQIVRVIVSEQPGGGVRARSDELKELLVDRPTRHLLDAALPIAILEAMESRGRSVQVLDVTEPGSSEQSWIIVPVSWYRLH